MSRSGFAAIIGAPNAGKSTLVNRLVGSKVSIVTHKVQTTRFPVRGVMMHGDAQVVLVDTPGIFAPKRRLDRAMVRSAWEGATDADAIVHLVDARGWVGGGDRAEDEAIIARMKELGKTAILALNKIDLVERQALLGAAKALFDTRRLFRRADDLRTEWRWRRPAGGPAAVRGCRKGRSSSRPTRLRTCRCGCWRRK